MLSKKLLISIVVLFVLLNSSLVMTVTSNVIWSKTYQKTGEQEVSSIVQTSDGGFLLAGSIDSDYPLDVFPPDWSDIWLVKTDANGNMEWNKTYSGEEQDYVTSMIGTSDGGFALAGSTESYDAMGFDFLLLKTDFIGNVEWNYTYGQRYNDFAYSMIETSDGGFAMVGETLSLTGNLEDYLLVKTDSSGKMEWSKIYGGAERDYAFSVVETNDRGFALLGYTSSSNSGFWLVKTDEFGNMQWNETYEREGLAQAYSLLKTSDGGFLLAGKTLQDYWLVKTDSEGNMEWNNSDYRENDQGWGGYPVIETSDGGFAFASSYYYDWQTSGKDCWLIKTDNQGNVVWNQTYTEVGDQGVAALIETSNRGFVLAGSSDILDHDGDFWLLITDQDGIPEFSSWTILPFLVVATLVGVTVRNKIRKRILE